MGYVASEQRMVIAYGNVVTATKVASVACTATEDAAYPVLNLAFDDPWRRFRFSSWSSLDRFITFTFSASQEISCIGLVNHTIFTTPLYLNIDIRNGGGGWTTGPGSIPIGSTYGNPNTLLRINPEASNQWRIGLLGTGANHREAFTLGMVFMGSYYELPFNPLEGAMMTTREVQATTVSGTGGSHFLGYGPTKRTERTEISFERISREQAQWVDEFLFTNYANKIIGIIPPEQLASAMPTGPQHLFGYLRAVNSSPRGGTTAGVHLYDQTIVLEGAV